MHWRAIEVLTVLCACLTVFLCAILIIHIRHQFNRMWKPIHLSLKLWHSMPDARLAGSRSVPMVISILVDKPN